MKCLLIIFTIGLLTHGVANAQTPVDTAAHAQSFETNKSLYIGQSFSTLVGNLQIGIKYFTPMIGLPYDRTQETSTIFAFYFPATMDEYYLTYPCIQVTWQTNLNALTSTTLFTTNKGGWTTDAFNFYSKAVIKDIKVILEPR